MAKLVRGMLHDALDAFARITLENVSEITWLDDDVDREYDNILRQLITRMMEDPKNITLTLDVVPAFLPFAKLREWQVWGNLNPYLNDSCGSIAPCRVTTRCGLLYVRFITCVN